MALVNRKPDYSDLDLDFIPHPTTGDVLRKTGADAIKRSIRNLILTNHYDRPFRSGIGSSVNKLLFENMNSLTMTFLKNAITETITNFEPRVSLTGVSVTPDSSENGINVTIYFTILDSLQPVQVNLFLERIR